MNEDNNFLDFISSDFHVLMNRVKSINPDAFMVNFHKIRNQTSFLHQCGVENFPLSSFSDIDVQFLIDHQYDFTKSVFEQGASFNKEHHLSTYIHEFLYNHWKVTFNYDTNSTDHIITSKNKKIPISFFTDYLLEVPKFQKFNINTITQYVIDTNPDYLHQLVENGFYLLHHAFKNQNTVLVEMLYKHGLDSQIKDNSNHDVEYYAKENTHMFSFYTEMEKKYRSGNQINQEENFETKLNILAKEIARVHGSVAQNYYADELIKQYQKDIPNLNDKEKELMYAVALQTDSMSFFKRVVQETNETKYSPKYSPLWTHLNNVKHQTVLYSILGKNPIDQSVLDSENPLTLSFINPETKEVIYFFSKYKDCMDRIGVSLYYGRRHSKYNSRGNQVARNKKIHEYILNNITLDYLLSNNSHENKNWFNTIIKSDSFNSYYYFMADISSEASSILDQTLSKDEKLVYILRNTWLAKDENNEFYNFDHIGNFYSIKLLQEILGYDSESNNVTQLKTYLLNPDEKIILFNKVFADLATSKNFIHNFLAELVEENLITYKDLRIEEKNIGEHIEKNYPNLHIVIQALKLKENLNQTELSNKPVKRMKV